MRITPDDIREVLGRMQGHRYERTEVQALFDSLNTMRDENDRLREALLFYADPWEYQIKTGRRPDDESWEPIPDFYDELDFGRFAESMLDGHQMDGGKNGHG